MMPRSPNVHGECTVGKWIVYNDNREVASFTTVNDATSFCDLKYQNCMHHELPPHIHRKKYWVVINISQYGGTAANRLFKHRTQHGAKDEAARLSRTNPGQIFVVMEATSALYYGSETYFK